MVLVTLGGCHLLDGLVVVSIEAHKYGEQAHELYLIAASGR